MPDNTCDISIAQYAIGMLATEELLAEVRQKANGAQVRFTGPRFPSTWDRRPTRINLQTDADKIIRSINCD